MKGKALKYSLEEINFVETHKTLTGKKLTRLFNETFNRELTVGNIKSLCCRKGFLTGRSGKFKKGYTPHHKGTKGLSKANSGSFKKGRIAENRKAIGHERARKCDGFILIKISHGVKMFKFKHRVIWEQHHGEIPKDCVIRFKDGNKQNCVIENLFLVTKKEHMELTRLRLHAMPDELKPLVKTLAELNIQARERAK